MYSEQFQKRQKNPIVAVHRNVGSTTFYDQKNASNQDFSFGVAHFFIRFNFTSAIYEKAYCHVNWIKFKATEFYTTTFMGHITSQEFCNGPQEDPNINSLVNVDDLIPSRFAMIFEKPNPVGFDMSFISLDPERMSETTNDGLFMDLGNNVLSYKSTKIHSDISDELEHFLNYKDL
jgi:hypothetical protein